MKQYLDTSKVAFEAFLEQRMAQLEAPAELLEAMNYSLLAPSKKMRPLFAIATASMFELEIEAIFPFAMAIEMIHTYSLIHDDLPAMDDDDLRRGRPTNHIVHGEALAILAGDALLTQSFEIVLETPTDEKTRIELVRLLSTYAGSNGMIAGQVLDMQGEGKRLTEFEMAQMHQKKTGYLLTAPIVGVALIAHASRDEQAALTRFGQLIGLAFQIQDDILDATKTSEALGKSASDIENEKSTYVSLLGLDASEERLANTLNDAITILDELDRPCDTLKQLVTLMSQRSK